MKFVDIIKTVGNVGSTVFLGAPIFSDHKSDFTDLIHVPDVTSQKIVTAIALAEKVGQDITTLTGADKATIASKLVEDAILLSPALTGSEVDDKTRFALGISKITDGWNDVLKSLKKR